MMLALLAFSIQAAPAPGVTVASLMGLTPAEVARRLDAPEPVGFDPLTIVENGQRVTVYPGAAFRPPAPEGQRCATRLSPSDQLDGGIGLQSIQFRARFVFRDNRLVAVRESPARQTPPVPARESRRQMIERYIQAGAHSDWPVATGRLPLSDGAALADRTTGLASSDSVIVTRCEAQPQAAAVGTQPQRFDDAGFVQGLALLPFAILLPVLNAERAHDAVAGPALLESVGPGDTLPNGAEAFVRGRPRVRLYRDAVDPDYGVIAVSVGNDRRNNLGRFNDVGMIGIRGDRVIWEASPLMVGSLGLKTAMCIAPDGRLDDVRPGCSNTGYFVFGD